VSKDLESLRLEFSSINTDKQEVEMENLKNKRAIVNYKQALMEQVNKVNDIKDLLKE
jgi:hypothetical protein